MRHIACTYASVCAYHEGAALSPRWSFEQDGDERWRWKRMDESEGATESVASFASEVDCMLDAVRFAVRQRRGEACANEDERLQ